MSVGPAYGYTKNYNFMLISYDFPRWQSYEHNNWNALDATLGTLFGTFGFGGVWQNGVTYNVNERIVDADENVLYLCLVDHVSAATGTFSQDRENNPSYWRSLSFTPSNRGNWAQGTQYNVQDIVVAGSQIAICTLAHLSSPSFANDVNTGYWSVLIDVTGFNTAQALAKSNNLSDISNVATARANLGLGSAAQNSTTDFLQTANNLSDGNVQAMLTSLGIGSAGLQPIAAFLSANNNLGDLVNSATARQNLGLGALATQSSVTVAQVNGGTTGLKLLAANYPSDATTIINTFTGDTGSGGVKGLVPAPNAGDANAGKFLRADGSFAVPAYPIIPNVVIPQASGINISTDTTHVYISILGARLVKIDGTSSVVLGPNGGYQINISTVGAGGIQNGLQMTAGFNQVFIISDGAGNFNALLGGPTGQPTLPNGFAYYVRIGYVYVKSATTFAQTVQHGILAEFAETPFLNTTGTFGSSSGTNATYATIPMNNNNAPPGAASYRGFMYRSNTSKLSLLSNRPSNTAPGGNAPPPVSLDASAGLTTVSFELTNISNNLYYVCTDSSGILTFSGWRDNL